jgi:hypothetical protein
VAAACKLCCLQLTRPFSISQQECITFWWPPAPRHATLLRVGCQAAVVTKQTCISGTKHTHRLVQPSSKHSGPHVRYLLAVGRIGDSCFCCCCCLALLIGAAAGVMLCCCPWCRSAVHLVPPNKPPAAAGSESCSQ